jgi:hypothetical protein
LLHDTTGISGRYAPPEFQGGFQMQEAIKLGSILFQEGTPFPEGFQLESASYSSGWRSVKGLDGYALDRKTHDAGWTFFYLAGETTATVIGREGQETVRKAIKRILAGLKSEKFNSLEVTRVVFKHFLGVPYATVSFHKRNMQEGMFLLGGDDSPAWKNARLAAA